MQPPKNIDVDGVTVKVKLRPLGRFPQGYGLGGTYYRNVITLDPGQTQRSLAVVLLHELLHHLWERAGLNRRYSTKTEEHILNALDSWLITVLRDNPHLALFLLGADE